MFAKAKTIHLCDSELLELLLFYTVPRRDTRDVAHDLLSTYGSLRNVLQAGPTNLSKIPGVGDNVISYITALNDLYNRCREGIKPTPLMVKTPYNMFWKYLDGLYGSMDHEVLDAYLLDSESCIYASSRLAQGDQCSVSFEPCQLSRLLVDAPPAGIMLVHNHPTGTCDPSLADRVLTEKCQLLCSLHNVMFCDHVIYANGQRFSFYDSGNLHAISVRYSVDNIIRKEGEENGER